MVAAVVVLYSLWILTVSAAFYVVRIDNLSQLFNAVFDAARWPVDVFSRVLQFVFTFVVPLAVMTTIPARALLGQAPGERRWRVRSRGRSSPSGSRGSCGTASIARYTSAGG